MFSAILASSARRVLSLSELVRLLPSWEGEAVTVKSTWQVVSQRQPLSQRRPWCVLLDFFGLSPLGSIVHDTQD